jgi:hypothetical protein
MVRLQVEQGTGVTVLDFRDNTIPPERLREMRPEQVLQLLLDAAREFVLAVHQDRYTVVTEMTSHQRGTVDPFPHPSGLILPGPGLDQAITEAAGGGFQPAAAGERTNLVRRGRA